MASKAAQARREIWPTRIAEALAVLVIVFSLGGAIGTGQGWWDFRQALQMMFIALVLAVLGLIIGVILMWRYRVKQPDIEGILSVCVSVCLIYLGYAGYMVYKARSVPAIHDVTTNSANPPEFVKLPMRADNWRNIPGHKDARFSQQDARGRWKMLHDEAYGDIKPLKLIGKPDFVISCAARLAKDEGWEIALSDPATGRLEATETVSLYRFNDDVLVQATLVAGEDRLSRVDMRSVSRVGQSDLGVNARRIRSFLGKLKADCKDVD